MPEEKRENKIVNELKKINTTLDNIKGVLQEIATNIKFSGGPTLEEKYGRK